MLNKKKGKILISLNTFPFSVVKVTHKASDHLEQKELKMHTVKQ